MPAGVFSGSDPDYGALLSYYLPRETSGVTIEVLDSTGTLVRRFDVPGDAGIDRASWDFLAEPAVPWNAARDWNKTWSAPQVVPGTYTVRLRAGDRTAERSLEVRADPRAHWTQAQYVARYDFLDQLDRELSSVDIALNRLDALHGRVPASQRHAFDAVYAQLTSGIVNSEDDQWRPDALRERLTILLGVVNLSQGPPLPPHLREAAEVRDQFERAMSAYHTFIEAYQS